MLLTGELTLLAEPVEPDLIAALRGCRRARPRHRSRRHRRADRVARRGHRGAGSRRQPTGAIITNKGSIALDAGRVRQGHRAARGDRRSAISQDVPILAIGDASNDLAMFDDRDDRRRGR